MIPTDIRVGSVFRYAYLWHRHYVLGREEGDKDRPCLVLAIVATDDDGSSVVRVLPITHAPPLDPEEGIEIPRLVKQRLKLDDARSWIILTESNRFVWPGPGLRPVDSDTGYFGLIPPNLFAEVKRRFVARARGHAHAGVPRTD